MRPDSNPISTDEYLLYCLAAAQEPALLELYARYSKAVYSLAKRMLRSDADAEEITQDVFVKIWHKAGDYAPSKGKVSTWILTIAHNSAIDALRRRKAKGNLEAFEDELERVADERPTKDLLEVSAIAKSLESLDAGEKICIELAYFEGLSHSQLAGKLELPLGTIKTRIRTGLEKLRTVLGDW